MPTALEHDTRQQDDGCWSAEVFPRDGKTSLRASCRLVSRQTLSLAGEPDLFVALWERRKGGFVVAHSTMGGREVGATAATVDDVEAAMARIETYCATLDPQAAVRTMDAALFESPLSSALSDLARRTARTRSFLALVGEALDEWQGVGTLDCPTAP